MSAHGQDATIYPSAVASALGVIKSHGLTAHLPWWRIPPAHRLRPQLANAARTNSAHMRQTVDGVIGHYSPAR